MKSFLSAIGTGIGKGVCKGSEARKNVAYMRIGKDASIVGARVKGAVVREEAAEVNKTAILVNIRIGSH